MRLQVIRRKPEEFKIACLLDLRSLWPAEHSPFYAGFGNRESDHVAYAAAGVPPARILIINPKGEIRHSSRTYCWASYPRLLQLAREMFPPIDTEEEQVEEDYTSFNYWKRPVAAIAPPAEVPATGAAIGTDAAAAAAAAAAASASAAAVAAAAASAAEEEPAPEEPLHGGGGGHPVVARSPRKAGGHVTGRSPARSSGSVAKDPNNVTLASPGRRGPGALVVLDLAREAHRVAQETGGELQPDVGLLSGGRDTEWHRGDDRGGRALSAEAAPPFTANAEPHAYNQIAAGSPTPRRLTPSPAAPSELEGGDSQGAKHFSALHENGAQG